MRLACALALLHAAAAGAAALRRGAGRLAPLGVKEEAAATFRAHLCNGTYADVRSAESGVAGVAMERLGWAVLHLAPPLLPHASRSGPPAAHFRTRLTSFSLMPPYSRLFPAVQCETPQLSADVRGLVGSNVTGSAVKLLRISTDHDLQEEASRQWRDLKFDLPPPPKRRHRPRHDRRGPAEPKKPAPEPKPECGDEPHISPDEDPCHGPFVGEKNLEEARRRMGVLEKDSGQAMAHRQERELDQAREIYRRLQGKPPPSEYPPKRYEKRPPWFPPPGWKQVKKKNIPGMRTFQTGDEGQQW